MTSPVSHDDSSSSSPSPSSTHTTTLDNEDSNWPTVVRKGTRSTVNPHPIHNFLGYHCLSPYYCSFISFVSSISIPKKSERST